MQADILIVGAGVVGLAVAAELSAQNRGSTIAVLEKYDKFGQETSSRNSEVIHAGVLNYPKGSLKAKLCVAGNKLLYEFLQKWDIPFQRIGKLLVAQDPEDEKSLENILQRARSFGVFDLEFLDRKQLMTYEPNLKAVAGIYSPSTGIMDTHRLMERLEYLAKKGGVLFGYRHEVIGVDPSGEGYNVTYKGPDGENGAIKCTWLINCAGLGASKIAEMVGIEIDHAGYKVHLCKAEYFGISNAKSHMIKHLVYPVHFYPSDGGGKKIFKWGHINKSLDGRLQLGPSNFYINEIDYKVDESNAKDIYNHAKNLIPFLEYSDLTPDMAGIRPRLSGPGDPVRDFVIEHEVDRGLKGVVNLMGIESPGLTSALSIADMVASFVRG